MDQFVPQFGNVTLDIVAFIVALSVIVAIHEYGHYIVGRWSGIDADVFSLGFGPVIWSRMDRRGTKWQIAALPFGGFVKFRGDADAASATPDTSVAPARNTMMGAPLWARSATVAAGPIFNFILSIIVFAALILARGQAIDPLTIAEVPDLPSEIAGEVQAGDQIIAIDGLALEDYPDSLEPLLRALPNDRLLSYTVNRDGDVIETTGPHPSLPFAQAISPRSAADDARLRPGDVVLSVDGEALASYYQLIDRVTSSEGREMTIVVWRASADGGAEMELQITPRSSDEPDGEGGFNTFYRLGISLGILYEPQTEAVGLWTSVRVGAAQVWQVITSSLSGLKNIIAGKISTCNLSGPVGIAETSGSMASQGLDSFIRFIAVLSTAVGLLNLFPIPVLDGGHLVFHAYEAVTGRPPSETALRVLVATGLSLILTLMVFAVANDIFLCP